MGKPLVMSTLPKTWILDLDGTLLLHNGCRMPEGDQVLAGARAFLDGLPREDYILILTSRAQAEADSTLAFLREQGIRYDKILFDMPMGERIVVNDRKPSGLDMAWAVNLDRNQFAPPEVVREL